MGKSIPRFGHSESRRKVRGGAAIRKKVLPEQFAQGLFVCVSKNGKTPVTASDVF